MEKVLGVPIEKWNATKEEIRQILITKAKERSFITYSDLVREIKTMKLTPDSILLFNMLGEISEEEDKNGRGMLSVIVVHKYGDMQPGKGFYNLAKKLGRDVSDKMACWVEEFKKVHGYWSLKSE